MAKQRYISTSIWDDDWFVEELSKKEKLFYFYLLTNEHTNIAGIYKISIRRIAIESAFEKTEIEVFLKRLEEYKKVCYSMNHIIMLNWPKHQKWQTSEKVLKGIIFILKALPKELLNKLNRIGYQFDLAEIDNVIISRESRNKISGTKKKLIIDLYKGKCSLCGSSEEIDIHHIKEVENGGNNNIINLIPVCKDCHLKIHKGYMEITPNIIKVHIGYVEKRKLDQKVQINLDSDSDINLDSDLDSNIIIKSKSAKHNFKKPQKEEFAEYCKEINYSCDYHKFYDYYQSKDWMIGKTRMKDWKAAVRNWQRNDGEKNPGLRKSAEIKDLDKCSVCGSDKLIKKLHDLMICNNCGVSYDLENGEWILEKKEDIQQDDSIPGFD